MKVLNLVWIGALSMAAGSAAYGQTLNQPLSVRPVGFNYNNFYGDVEAGQQHDAPAAPNAATEAAPAAAAPAAAPHSVAADYAAPAGDCNCGPQALDAAPCYDCQPSCNDSCGGCGLGSGLCECNLGEAWTLNRFLYGNCPPSIDVGGWFSVGYHSESNDLFNDRPDELALHQGWFYLGREATESNPFGFRADFVYGIDGADTQSFGNDPGEWDFQNGFDHGAYSWAIPQLYAEIALGDWTVKAGHFYTLIGYEVVTAPDNFFYSHAITMNNTEPFTHTGVVASRSIGDDLTVHAGWTLGWDTGFDQFNDGSSWLGGFSYSLGSDASFTYISSAGNLGARGEDAYGHSIVFDTQLTDRLNWVLQSDVLRVASTGEDNVGINQYFLYSVNDCLGLGARLEWWKADNVTGYAPHGAVLPADGSFSYYAATFGVNVRPAANVIVRPEVRVDWSPAADYEETYFGVDAIFTF